MTEPHRDAMADSAIDHAVLLRRFEGDRDLLREVIGLFLADYPTRLSAVHAAVEQRDGPGLFRAAHSIKGSVANFDATVAFEAALRLEQMGRANDFVHSREACAALEREIRRLTDALAPLR